jgi:superfamily II DNA or RNA helicase
MPQNIITKKRLIDWGGERVVRDAEAMVSAGQVLEAHYDHPTVTGAVLWNNRRIETGFKILKSGHIESLCPCYANKERGLICAHIMALGLTLVQRAADPDRQAKYKEEMRRAARMSEIDESEYIQRVPASTPGAIPAKLVVTLPANWLHAYQAGSVPVEVQIHHSNRVDLADEVPRNLSLSFSKRDESLLFVLEDISEGPAKGELTLGARDFVNLVGLHKGTTLAIADESELIVETTPLPTHFQMDIDGETGELLLYAHTELPYMKKGQFAQYVVAGRNGWAHGAGHFWPLENVLPEPYHPIYRDPIVVARTDVLQFLQREVPLLARHTRVESDISLDLFSIDPATPSFRLEVHGSPASLSATLYAVYDELALVACRPDSREHFAIPDPDDLMRYTGRNLSAEQAALAVIAKSGLRGPVGDALEDIVGERLVLNFLGSWIPALRRRGWDVDLVGRVAPFFDSMDAVTPVVHIEDESGEPWFDVSFGFEDTAGASLSLNDIQRAIRRGDSFTQSNGRRVLIDTMAIESMLDVFTDCDSDEATHPGHFRMDNIYAPFVKASLEGLDGVDIEDTPRWRIQAGQCNRSMAVTRVALRPELEQTLRPYQREGVDWMRFLECNGFGGILADEMGLGKTIQTLAWIELQRTTEAARGRPTLIVCPTSLVDNWAEEAARFTPALSVLRISGPDRHDLWTHVGEANIVVTSYALLRRDLDQHLEHHYAAAILDEAQHIKNRSTRNAVAVKQIKAHQKLVLTGTPVENSVSDLWSIMDFLMPGYLGRHDAFRQNYELPISRGGPEAESAQLRLRRKLHPFLLRRLKRDVAKDLPPKIERVSTCTLSADQRLVYNELLRESKRKIADMVAEKGFNRCRMEILTTLMRLRQVCCHLSLLKLPDLKTDQPSAKLDIFMELVNEALDGGHRILVFSQFVTMLHLLRDELDHRSISYCYLDGSTKERLTEVHRFNTQRDIPIFLISLKAGGTGLNLTGADMVIHFDPWWNPAVEDQATDRAYRIGQKRTVYSVKLICADTVEEKVLELQKRKKAIIDATVESDEAMIESMNWSDVQELLDL